MTESRNSKQKYEIGSPVCYDGPNSKVCKESAIALFGDLAIEAGIQIPPKSHNVIVNSITRFIDCFFKEVSRLENGELVKEFADLCKERRNELLSLSNMVAIRDYAKIPESLHLVTSNEGHTISLEDASYYPDSLRAVFVMLREEGLILDYVTIERRPRFYIYLYKIVFELVKVFHKVDLDSCNKQAIRAMYLLPCTIGQIYEKLNPTLDVMEQYAEDLLSTLRQPANPPTERFLDLADKVKKDILDPRCRKPYVKDFKRALGEFRIQSFSIQDFYATLKASTSIVEEGKHKRKYPSFVSSLFETDELRGDPIVEAFDKYIQYESAYLTQEELNQVEMHVKTLVVLTKMIENPSKYKPRGIHLGSNALQDRCSWIHHQLSSFLKSLKCDCMKRHMKGVEFLKRITTPSYRSEHRNSIFVSDFSNATDTLSQEFQCFVLGILFPQEVVDFWRFVSQLPKEFYLPYEKRYEHYIQETGQPQGLLGSFDCFSLAHHFLMLMLMYESGMTGTDSETFYRILGDDSIVSFDSRSEVDVYANHSWLCKEATLVKNDSKTAKSLFRDDGKYPEIIMDFAKISVFEGEFCSPLPVSLGLSYMGDPKITNVSAVLWFNAHGITFKKWFLHITWRVYGKEPIQFLGAISILTSGQIDYLKDFEFPEVANLIDSELKGASIYCYGISEFRNTLLGYFISEEKRQETLCKGLTFEEIWRSFFPEKIMERMSSLISKNHKFWRLLEFNIRVAEEIQVLYEIGDTQLASLIGAIVHNEDVIQDIQILTRYKLYVESVLGTDHQYEAFVGVRYQNLFSQNKSLGNLQVRSFREKVTRLSQYLLSSVKELESLKTLGDIPEETVEGYSNVLQWMSRNVYNDPLAET